MSPRGTEQTGVSKSHTHNESYKWEINDQNAQDFQKLTIILKVFCCSQVAIEACFQKVLSNSSLTATSLYIILNHVPRNHDILSDSGFWWQPPEGQGAGRQLSWVTRVLSSTFAGIQTAPLPFLWDPNAAWAYPVTRLSLSRDTLN